MSKLLIIVFVRICNETSSSSDDRKKLTTAINGWSFNARIAYGNLIARGVKAKPDEKLTETYSGTFRQRRATPCGLNARARPLVDISLK